VLSKVEAWPTDRVQIGLQVLLLEDAGYQVPEAILYYASEKRRVALPVDQALRDEALAVLEQAKMASQGPRPEPLVHDSRCLRCSLQPICLPDELVQQKTAESSRELTPRKLWPPRDDAIHVVAQTQGAKVTVSGLSLKIKDREGKTIRELPMSNVDSLALLGSVQVTTQALQALSDAGIPVGFLSAAGRMVTMMDPLDSVSAKVRVAQVRAFDDPARILELARALMSAKISNQKVLLARNHPDLPQTVSQGIQEMLERSVTAPDLASLRGIEGQAAALYFGEFGAVFKGEEGKEFQALGRQRRPPPDPVNSCLSFAYAMLTHECTAALRLARLEPSIGAYHVSRPGRPALALDLMEPFRPLIADSVAVSAFNRGELKMGHFNRTA
ncbi:MAG: CRISPR-associated endonuclease Cas1, partial [bacterium]